MCLRVALFLFMRIRMPYDLYICLETTENTRVTLPHGWKVSTIKYCWFFLSGCGYKLYLQLIKVFGRDGCT